MSTFEGIEDLDGEIWANVKDYEGKYYVSTKGRAVSARKLKSGMLYKLVGAPWNSVKNKKYKNATIYKVVKLSKNGKAKDIKMHRLVAQAFIPNPNNYPEVNHIDGNGLNNCIENLEWCTTSQNVLHSRRILKRGFSHQCGTKHGNVRLNWNIINTIRTDYANNINLDYTELSIKYKVSKDTIAEIIKNESWIDESYIPPKCSNYFKRHNIKEKKKRVQIVDLSISKSLNPTQIKEIRDLYNTNKYSQKQLASMYGVSRALISDVINYKRCFAKV